MNVNSNRYYHYFISRRRTQHCSESHEILVSSNRGQLFPFWKQFEVKQHNNVTCENFAQSLKNPFLQAGKMIENQLFPFWKQLAMIEKICFTNDRQKMNSYLEQNVSL